MMTKAESIEPAGGAAAVIRQTARAEIAPTGITAVTGHALKATAIMIVMEVVTGTGKIPITGTMTVDTTAGNGTTIMSGHARGDIETTTATAAVNRDNELPHNKPAANPLLRRKAGLPSGTARNQPLVLRFSSYAASK